MINATKKLNLDKFKIENIEKFIKVISCSKFKEARCVAKNLFLYVGLPSKADIQEIPVVSDNCDGLVVLFFMPNDDKYYSLDLYIEDDEVFIQLAQEGVLIGDEFEFFETPIELDIDYFI